VHIGNNVWIGDSVIVCKGVTIGDNSIIGAGSIVVRDVPPNCIAAGNPAKIVKHLEADKPMKTRGEWFSAPEWLEFQIEDLDRKMLDGNTILDWMRSLLFPVVGD
jgi:carbonic anhydrase/acetyltransferase-like protein (isoleucine patch superfamily)